MKRFKRFFNIPLLIFSLILCLFISFILTYPVKVGLIETTLGENIARYLGFHKDNNSNRSLIEALKSQDSRNQIIAMIHMATGEQSEEVVDSLVTYIKDSQTTPSMKNIAIWALGELKAKKALNYLISLRSDKRLSSYELDKSIKKIDNRHSTVARITR